MGDGGRSTERATKHGDKQAMSTGDGDPSDHRNESRIGSDHPWDQEIGSSRRRSAPRWTAAAPPRRGGPAGDQEVLFIGRGTSDNAAVYGSYLIQAYAGRLATLARRRWRRRTAAGPTCPASSPWPCPSRAGPKRSSRRSTGRRMRRATLAITNRPRLAAREKADLAFVTQAGTERAVPATKTFITQLAALACSPGPGRGPGPWRTARGAGRDRGMLSLPTDFGPIVAELRRADGIVVSGRGLAYSAALELALKLKEACYLHAMGLSYADLLHGPIAVVDADTPAIVLAAERGRRWRERLSWPPGDKRGRGGLGHRRRRGLAAACSRALPGPRLPEWLAPMGLIVPGQLLTEALSRALGLNPDSPRGLSKVTQTD